MKEQILIKSTDLFLAYGFKSVTMDQIAQELGISKKTIYTHFGDKRELVKSCTFYLFETICAGVENIICQEKNPIEEFFEIKTYVLRHLKDEKSSPQYQLQKYYPKIYQTLISKQLEYMQESIIKTLQRGIEQQLFRKEMDVDFISRIYFVGMTGIKNSDLFPRASFEMNNLLNDYLEYHLRAIVTENGLITLTNYLQKNA